MKVQEIIEDLEFCKGIFDYTISPNEITKLVDYIKQLQQENNQLKEQIIKLKLSNKYKNILYDLKEWLEEEMNKNFLIKGTDYIESSFARVLSKIDELEGGKNE